MQTLRGILNFTRVAELGSFAAAARDLGISAVAVSQNISRLEESLGVRLIARSTRALQLTSEGQAFWEQCKGPLDQLAMACKDVANDGKSTEGRVRATIVRPMFYKQYPGITLELEMSEDSMPLISKRFDVGIRVGALNDEAFVARPLGPMRLLICNDFRALKQACVDRLGIAQLPQPMVLDVLKTGVLKTLLPDHVLDGWQLFIHYPSRKQLPARVRAFVDFCIEHFGKHRYLTLDTAQFLARS